MSTIALIDGGFTITIAESSGKSRSFNKGAYKYSKKSGGGVILYPIFNGFGRNKPTLDDPLNNDFGGSSFVLYWTDITSPTVTSDDDVIAWLNVAYGGAGGAGVSQAITGTQEEGAIPSWTSVARELSKGDNDTIAKFIRTGEFSHYGELGATAIVQTGSGLNDINYDISGMTGAPTKLVSYSVVIARTPGGLRYSNLLVDVFANGDSVTTDTGATFDVLISATGQFSFINVHEPVPGDLLASVSMEDDITGATADIDAFVDTYDWSDNQGNSGEDVLMESLTQQDLSYGVKISFSAESGHTATDSFDFTSGYPRFIKSSDSGKIEMGDLDGFGNGVKFIIDDGAQRFRANEGYFILAFDAIDPLGATTLQQVQAAIAAAVAGLLDLRGTYDASSNLFPATGGSGAAGAILKGDTWYISVAGTLGGTAVAIGDVIFARVDTPAQTAGNWEQLETNFGYVAENVANKQTDLTASATKYPTVNAVLAGLAGYATLNIVENAQTGTTYTLALTDNGKYVTMNNAAANVVTIPTNASVALPIGTLIPLAQKGAGATTVTGAGGVTVNGSVAGSVTLAGQWKGASLYKSATDTWIVIA